MRKMADRCRRFWEGFLNGPRWFSVPSAGKKGRYVSSSLMLFLWIYALLDRFLTPQGRMFGAVYLAVSFYSMILTRSPAVVLFFVLSGVIFFNLIMQIVNGFRVFTESYIITDGGPMDSTLSYVLYLYRRAFTYFDMGYSCALAWILVAIIAVFTIILFKTQNRWVYYETGED